MSQRHSKQEPVVVTGLGISLPTGYGLQALNFRASKPLVPSFNPISQYDVREARIRFGGECPDLEKQELRNRKLLKLVSRKDLLGIITAQAALQDAGLAGGPSAQTGLDPDRAGCFIGACSTQLGDFMPYLDVVMGCVSDDRETFDSARFGVESLARINPISALKVMMNGCLAHVCQLFDLRGANANYMDLDLAGVAAVDGALQAIRSGRVDWALAGAMCAPFDPFQMGNLFHTGALADHAGLTAADCGNLVRPFDRNATGTIMSEGSVFLVLESASHAQKRGAPVLARMHGAAMAAGPARTADHAAPSLTRALDHVAAVTGVDISDVAVIATDAPGHAPADRTVAASIGSWTRSRGLNPDLFSLKGLTGDLCEASALVSVAALVAGFRGDYVPPTVNLTQAQPFANGLKLSPTADTPPSGGLALVTALNRFGSGGVLLMEAAQG